MRWLLILFAILAGISNPLQSGSNAGLQKTVDAPIVSAFIVYAVGSLCLLALIPALGFSMSDLGARLARAPWWIWIGGICNALFLLASLIVTRQLGSATFTTCIVVAAVITSLALDHFGLLGFEVRSLTPMRFAGGAMAVGGVAIVTLAR